MKLSRLALITTITAVGLSACGSNQPSEREAKAAIAATFTQASNGAMEVKDFQNFQLNGCRDAEPADGVICDLGGAVVVSYGGTEQVRPFVAPVRFSKASGIWTANKP